MSENPGITNAGAATNLERQTSLAEAIAGNLTAGRQEAEQARTGEQPKAPAPREPVRQAEPAPEPEAQAPETPAPEEQAEGTDTATVEQAEEAPEFFTLDDFAAAAELDQEAILDRVMVDVPGKGDAQTRETLRKVLEGYRWNAANTQRAQALAEERRQVESRASEINQMHAQAEAVLQAQWADVDAEEQALNQQYHAMPWEQLKAQGAGQYADAEAQFSRRRQEIADRRNRLQGAYAKVTQERQALIQRQQAEELPRQKAKLLEFVPSWQDEQRADKEGKAIMSHLADRYGFDPGMLSAVDDARVVAMWHRLWTLEQQAEGVPLAEKKVSRAPKPLKPGTRTSRQDASQKRQREMRARLKRSGRRDDLAAMVLNNLRS